MKIWRYCSRHWLVHSDWLSIWGWYAVLMFCMIPRVWQSSLEKTDVNLGLRSEMIRCVTISDLALFNFLLLYDVASKVSPTWLTPVYLWFVQVAVTWLHLSPADWNTSPLIDDSLLVCCCDSVLGGYTCTFLIVLPRYISQACWVASGPRLDFFRCTTVLW